MIAPNIKSNTKGRVLGSRSRVAICDPLVPCHLKTFSDTRGNDLQLCHQFLKDGALDLGACLVGNMACRPKSQLVIEHTCEWQKVLTLECDSCSCIYRCSQAQQKCQRPMCDCPSPGCEPGNQEEQTMAPREEGLTCSNWDWAC
jgi:hypothetical protein